MAGKITLLRLQRAGTTTHYTQGAATLYPGLCTSALTARQLPTWTSELGYSFLHIKLYTLLIYLGYHFYSRRDGTTTQHRKLLEVGAHAKPYNRCSIGICYEGGRDEQGRFRDTRTPKQKERMEELVIMMRKLFPNAMVVGHRDLLGATPKLCPCFEVQREFRCNWIWIGYHKRQEMRPLAASLDVYGNINIP